MEARDYHDPQAGDDPTAAFDRLRGEVSLLRSAIEGLTVARESIDIPDYQPTLARTEKILAGLVQQVDGMSKSPAMTLTPETMGQRLNAAVADTASELRTLIHTTRADMSGATRDLQSMARSWRVRDVQDRWVYGAGLGGMVAGLMIYAVLAGPVARFAPASWRWPERVATRVLAEPSLWDAGQHLMRVANPEAWGGVTAAANLVRDNRDAIEVCRRAAAKTRKAARCTIEVRTEGR